MLEVDSIWLAGPRGSGKSKNGKIFAEQFPSWRHFDIDTMIEEQTGHEIGEITASLGWRTFRLMEHLMAHKLKDEKHAIISTGGGLFVNDIPVVEDQPLTYGELNKNLVRDIPGSRIVLLTASDEVLRERVRNGEQKKFNARPILDPKEAARVALLSPEKQIEERVNASMSSYYQRIPLYNALTPYLLDTTFTSAEENAMALDRMFS